MDPLVCSRYVLVTDRPLGQLREVLKFGGVKVDRTKKLIAVAGAAAVVAALGACGSKNTPAAGSATGNYILGTTDTQVTSLDPAGAYDLPSWTIQYNIYQQLVTYQPNSTKPTPYAAKSCDYTDPQTVKCVLNSGIKYSNGDPMVASDVTYSFKRSIVINDSSAASSLLADLSDGDPKKPDLAKGAIETPDSSTVIFHLNAPDTTFIQALTTPAASIIDPKVYPADKLLADDQSIGSGPYQLSQFQPGQQAVLTANPDYSGPNAPKAAQVTVQYFNSDTALTTAIGSGQVDVAWRTFSPTELNSLKSNSKVDVLTGKGAEFRYWVFRTQSGPGKSVAVRQAAAQIIDRDAIAQKAYDGTVNPGYSTVPPGFLGANEAFKAKYGAPDVAKAKQILSQAGVSTPVAIKLGYTPSHYGPNAVDEANEFAQELTKSGLFKVSIDDAEFTQYQDLYKQGAYDLFQLGWFPDYLDPDDYISPFLHDGGFFANGYSSKQMDKLIAQERAETDATKRAKQIGQIQDLTAQDAPMIPSWFGQNNAVAIKGMTGVSDTLDQAYIFRMWLPSKSN
jgi:peptide/nickel transport system substrate-binding protein